jgi:hypothetical protein
MGTVIFQLTPFIIGSAVLPLQIMMIILLLNRSSQGLTKAVFLVAGMTVIRLLQGIIFGLILFPRPGETGGKSLVVSSLMLVLGILLLITAYKQWRNEDDPDAPPPKWMVMLDTISPFRVFAMGAGLILISGKLWVFTLSAIGVIGEAQLGQPSSTVAFLLFVLLAQSMPFLTLIVRVISPEQSKPILATTSAWLTKYNRPIVMVVALVFGLLFFFQGASGLLQ